MYILKSKLREILDEKNITIKEIADFINIRYATIQRVVATEYLDTTSLVVLVRIAEYLNMKVDDLYEYVGMLKGKRGKDMLEIDKYMREGQGLAKLYCKEKGWTEKELRKNMAAKIEGIRKTLKKENREDFMHELILIHSEVGGNMSETGKLISDESWIENGYAFIAGFYGVKEY